MGGKKDDVRGGGWLGLKASQRAGAAIMCLLIAYTRPHDLSFYLLTCIQLIGRGGAPNEKPAML
ncbi:hypothetical protein TIFTF001_000310 [Ficus carica]|uniref:Uncharacterized protein n=1 Tax=Ficus carica TaxID=3494 RepID=A0AA87ZFP8_FICCA|nr:hypothetical protein TIFTF001_000310 [Ficus carica]